MFFWKKQKMIIELINSYIMSVTDCMKRFSDGYVSLISRDDRDLKQIVEDIHRVESRADDLRREIELRLYKDALIPESRGDILRLLEALDKIPNSFNDISYRILLQKMLIPPELTQGFVTFKDKNLEACSLLFEAVKGLFDNFDVMDKILQIDAIESACDRLQHELVARIFSAPYDKADMLFYNNHIEDMGKISNEAQNVAYQLQLTIIKRRI